MQNVENPEVLAISKTDKEDAVDFRGNSVDNSKTGGWLAAGLILGTELSERICVMEISMNLVTYLVGELHLSSSKSANTGVTLLTLATTIPSMKPPHCDNPRKQHCIEASGSQLAMLYVALYTIALGGGGIKSNVSEDGGYGISAGTMIIAVIVLICGTTMYRFKKPQGSPLTVIWRVVFLAIKNRNHPYPANPGFLNEYSNSKVPHTTKFRALDKAAILIDYANSDENRNNPWIVSTVTQVEEVKMVIRMVASAIVEKKRREMHRSEMKEISAFWYKVQNYNGGSNGEDNDIENWNIRNIGMIYDIEVKKAAIGGKEEA
ncbi:hypothetical protein L1987_78441 [Smallanthus sonchifolius]|uniref:Uncharacterized protein n=1 Tax=Smallanthus sonchifolius TaxID=185202 RepID=A0ACB8ZBV6_9ASTR|nr:hypothetical protein L1987_78441 [Smallanthus sonchifolius]